MDRIYLNQTALSLGYIALKRIRALEAPSSRLPSNPLLRHIGHIKILAACVEQVGPEVIIEYEINQDYGVAGTPEPPEPASYDHVERVAEDRRIAERTDAADDVFERRYRSSTRSNNATKPLAVINEDVEESKVGETVVDQVPRKKALFVNVTPIDFDDEGDYSMDELYDEYNGQDDDWETASELSEDGQSFIDDVPPSSRDGPPSPRSFRSIDTDSEEEDDIPCTPPSIIVSRSPPLDINMRHPITHELNRREQYRRQASSDLSCGFVEQIEDVLCQEMRYLSMKDVPGEMQLGNHTHHRVSLYV